MTPEDDGLCVPPEKVPPSSAAEQQVSQMCGDLSPERHVEVY